MDLLGKFLCPNPHVTRSTKSNKIAVPVHGYPELVVSLMATAWNENSDLCNASTLIAAKRAAKKWARTLST